MEETVQNKKLKRTKYFYIALALLFLAFLLSANTDLGHFSSRNYTGVPIEFFYIIFSVDFLVIFSMVLIYLYKKAGAILFPMFILIHFMLYNFYLSTTLLSDLNVLFVYFAAGLLVIIPRWNEFK